jgi:pyoverdine/dityrosine biosynthesis protein Dit1
MSRRVRDAGAGARVEQGWVVSALVESNFTSCFLRISLACHPFTTSNYHTMLQFPNALTGR